MSDLAARFATWMAEHDLSASPATPAATVLVLREADEGPEVLMVQRSSSGSFASAWVFPGGKVDAEDYQAGDDIIEASRRAASREASEEADLVIDDTELIPFSHWMPPVVVPRRFSTWFYLTSAPHGTDGDVTIDGGEIVDHLWVRPGDALDRHAAGEVELVPPTWVTLHDLARFASATEAIAIVAEREPFFYLTRLVKGDHPTVVWHGDAAYETGDLRTPGTRHRLAMRPDGWTFEPLSG